MSEIFYDPIIIKRLIQESIDLSRQDQDDQAILCLKKIMELKVDISKLGLIGLKKAFQEKTIAISEFGKIVLKTKLTNHRLDFAHTVGHFRVDNRDKNIEDVVLLCLQDPSINPQNLAGISLSLLSQNAYSPKDPLLLSLMTTTILPDSNLEIFLKELRKELLLHSNNINVLNDYRSFIYALSCQCYLNEYIYSTIDTENLFVEQLLCCW